MLVLAKILGFGEGLARNETEWEKGRFKMGSMLLGLKEI